MPGALGLSCAILRLVPHWVVAWDADPSLWTAIAKPAMVCVQDIATPWNPWNARGGGCACLRRTMARAMASCETELARRVVLDTRDVLVTNNDWRGDTWRLAEDRDASSGHGGEFVALLRQRLTTGDRVDILKDLRANVCKILAVYWDARSPPIVRRLFPDIAAEVLSLCDADRSRLPRRLPRILAWAIPHTVLSRADACALS